MAENRQWPLAAENWQSTGPQEAGTSALWLQRAEFSGPGRGTWASEEEITAFANACFQPAETRGSEPSKNILAFWPTEAVRQQICVVLSHYFAVVYYVQ